MPLRAVVLMAATLTALSRASHAQAPTCDAVVATVATDPARYQLRDGNRCEGVFIQSVAGSSSLRIASLTQSYEAFSDTTSRALHVSWNAPTGTRVHLRGYSLKASLHYRMETVVPVTTGAYDWPTNVLRSLRMRKPDVGVVATATMTVGDSVRDVLVPVRVSQQASPDDAQRYQLVLWSNTELTQVFLGIERVGVTGLPRTIVQTSTELGYGVYPAGRGIPVRLPPLGAAGVYIVSIGGIRRSGGSSTTSFLLYHPGR